MGRPSRIELSVQGNRVTIAVRLFWLLKARCTVEREAGHVLTWRSCGVFLQSRELRCDGLRGPRGDRGPQRNFRHQAQCRENRNQAAELLKREYALVARLPWFSLTTTTRPWIVRSGAVSSAVERSVYTREVGGSKPSPPTRRVVRQFETLKKQVESIEAEGCEKHDRGTRPGRFSPCRLSCPYRRVLSPLPIQGGSSTDLARLHNLPPTVTHRGLRKPKSRCQRHRDPGAAPSARDHFS
jgi:hypothetical protein